MDFTVPRYEWVCLSLGNLEQNACNPPACARAHTHTHLEALQMKIQRIVEITEGEIHHV